MTRRELKRPQRDDTPFKRNVFPETTVGKLLNGFTRSFLIKQEPRMGWARKNACGEEQLFAHPCEVVASHQWGVAWLLMNISKLDIFQKEFPQFRLQRALEMALTHDLAELDTGDITPVDGLSPEEKHRLESDAMQSILGDYPDQVSASLHDIYTRYEMRSCKESKFVKDCDRLDFMITAFVLERQGFRGFEEFYGNANRDFTFNISQEIANVLTETRNKLADAKQL